MGNSFRYQLKRQIKGIQNDTSLLRTKKSPLSLAIFQYIEGTYNGKFGQSDDPLIFEKYLESIRRQK